MIILFDFSHVNFTFYFILRNIFVSLSLSLVLSAKHKCPKFAIRENQQQQRLSQAEGEQFDQADHAHIIAFDTKQQVAAP